MVRKSGSQFNLNNISSVYLFSGEVDSRRTDALKELLGAVVDPASELYDLERFEGSSSSSAQILPAVMTMPFSSSRKVVVVDRVDRLSADDQSRIADFIPRLGAQSCLILLSGDENPARKRKGQSRQPEEDEEDTGESKQKKGLQPTLANAVKKHGVVLDFSKMKAEDITTLIAQRVRGIGKKIDPPALQMLSYSMQSSPSLIDKEVEKLLTYIGDRNTITSADVDKVATRSPEDRVFPLIDAVAAGRTDTAIRLLNETLAASAKPESEVPKVLALLGKHFRNLFQVKYLITEGKQSNLNCVDENLREMLMQSPNPLAAQDWQRRKFLEQARHFTQGELGRCLKDLLSCELAFKGQGKGSSSPRLNLEMLILKISQRKTFRDV